MKSVHLDGVIEETSNI